MPRSWRTRSSELVLDTPWYRVRHDVVELPDGAAIDYYLSERPDAAAVFPLTPDGQVVMVRQYKHGVGAVLLELPGGVVDAGEQPCVAARRELREETGYAPPGRLEDLGAVLQDPSKATNTVFCFLARDVVPAGSRALDDNEAAGGMAVELHPLADVEALIDAGEVVAQSSVLTILKALRRLP